MLATNTEEHQEESGAAEARQAEGRVILSNKDLSSAKLWPEGFGVTLNNRQNMMRAREASE